MRRLAPLHAACVLASLLASAALAPTSARAETPAEKDARMKWWREARFGMFIHWGVYSVPAGEYKGQRPNHIGEWIMLDARIPVAEYRAFAREFNPVKYDPDAWAQLAKDAGMKYMVITSKHHDGFALFPSDASEWDIADASPYGRDLIGPLADAARRRGLRFGLYYSQAQDWVNPGGAKAKQKTDKGWDPAQDGDFDKYLDQVAAPQVREILTRYQPDVLWWDTPVKMNPARAARLAPLLALRPGIITNDRLERPDYPGDFGTPEQKIPDTGLDRDWETCMTMNHTWGYKFYDHDWKSVETLLTNLIDCASKGGNYLLNIGPKPDGTIPDESIERLRAIGKWMSANGESIYATTASPTASPPWGRITTKAGDDATTLYLHAFDWPTDGKLTVAVTNEVKSCRLLADPTRTFETQHTDAGLTVQLTGAASDPICSTIALEIAGKPQVIKPPLSPEAVKEIANLQGEWSMVSGSADGYAIPDAMRRNFKRVCQGDEITVINGGQLLMKAKIEIDPSRNPKTIDYHAIDGPTKGQRHFGIYELDGETLKSCFSAPGGERPADYNTKPGDRRTSTVWKRAK